MTDDADLSRHSSTSMAEPSGMIATAKRLVTASITWNEFAELRLKVRPDAVGYDEGGPFIRLGRLVLRPLEDRTDETVVEFLRQARLSPDSLLAVAHALGLRS